MQENFDVSFDWKHKLLSLVKKNWKYLVTAVIFLSLGIYMGGGRESPQKGISDQISGKSSPKKKVIWTCSMHPQIRMPKPGKCPICFMDLIPLEEGAGGGDKGPRVLAISEQAKVLAQIETATVERRPVTVEVRLVGRVTSDETRVETITSWVGGRIDRMYVDYTGVRVRRGDHLVKLYSPELIAAQEELLQSLRAYRRAKQRGVTGTPLNTLREALQSARRKLLLWGLRKWQIERIEKSGIAQEQINIYSPMSGIVIEKMALEGMYVKEGTPLYKIADLSQVWIIFDAYERDLPWIRVGQKVKFSTLAYPGQSFEGEIVYIDPVLNPKMRTVRVRVNAKNRDELLKPDMFVRGIVHVEVNSEGLAKKPSLRGLWRCPMHPEVVRWKKGFCPICGMPLERIRWRKDSKGQNPLVIPVSAPLLTGKRAVVYVKKPKEEMPTYEGREVVLGPKAGEFFIVLSGLKEGEEVVSNGAFKLDSELQIRAKPSMMNPQSSGKKGELPSVEKWKGVSSKFISTLSPIYREYFAISSALSSDDSDTAQGHFTRLRKVMSSSRWSRWSRKIEAWRVMRVKLFDIASKGAKLSYLSGLRRVFDSLSTAIIELDRSAGHPGVKSHYVAFCPMAFKGKGAFWLQNRGDKIFNPYMGKKMLSCGDIKLEIKGWEGRPVRASVRFLNTLTPLYRSYFSVQSALFTDDLVGAKSALQRFVKALGKRRVHLLPRRWKRRWLYVKSQLLKGVKGAQELGDIEKFREKFYQISKGMLQLVFIFGHNLQGPIFETFCPMAFDNRGAAWLQVQDRRVHNPYFGKKMPYCGEIKRSFSPAYRNSR